MQTLTRTRALLLTGIWLIAAPAPGSAGELAESFWRERDELPPAQAENLVEYCAGAYLPPDFPYPIDSDPAEFVIEGQADGAEYLFDGAARLTGNVRIVQGNRMVSTEHAAIDGATRDGTLAGGVRVVDPTAALSGDQATVNLTSGALRINDVEFLLFDSSLRGTAASVDQDEAGTLTMRKGTFTRCAPGNNDWYLSAAELQAKKGENFATARGAVLRVKDVPVLYVPYLRFPVTDERQSGLLFPSLEYSNVDGLDLALPYYFNLAPHYDATVTPRFIAKRGLGVDTELRHLSGWQRSEASAAFLGNDDLYNGTYSRDDFNDLVDAGLATGSFEPDDRWLLALNHSGGFDHFTTFVDYAAVSDRDYFRDLGSDLGVSSEIQLERLGQIEYSRGGLQARVWAQHFQRLDENPVEPYERLPEIDLRYTGVLPGPFQWSVDTRWASFDRDNDNLVGVDRIVGDRLHAEPRLSLRVARPWGFFNAGGGYRYTQYDLRDVPDGTDDSPDRGIALATVNAGLLFERPASWFGAAVLQTLEPQVYYLYQEFEDQQALPRFDATELTFSYSQLFRDNRFAGLDRIGDAKQVSAGLTSRFVDARDGSELFRASVGQIAYLEDRRVTLGDLPDTADRHSSSALVSEVAARLARSWHFTGAVVWDPHDTRLEEAGAALQYRRDNRRIVNLGYRNRAIDAVDQTDVSIYWPVSSQWSVLGRWNYDLSDDRTIEAFAGIEYNDCCWQLRLVGRRFINRPSARLIEGVDEDEGIFLQIVFKGLAGVGGTLENVLQRGIPGYQTETF